jgi:ribonuclease P/MRP protein subunit RPP40
VAIFIINTNDLPNAITKAKSILFADDTTVYAASASLPGLFNDVNSDLNALVDWFRANKLSLNVAKTNYVLFSRNTVTTHLEIKIGDISVERKHHTKFLGVLVDEKLEWSEHISHVKAKLSSSLYALSSSKNDLTPNLLLMLYNALVYPYLSYGVLLWSSTYKTHLNKIVIIQKKAVRIIANAPYYSHTNNIFHQYNILKFTDICNLYLGKYMYQQLNSLLPEPLSDTYSSCSDIHAHNTR